MEEKKTGKKSKKRVSPFGVPCPLSGEVESYGWKRHFLGGVEVRISQSSYLKLRREIYLERKRQKYAEDPAFKEKVLAKRKNLPEEVKETIAENRREKWANGGSEEAKLKKALAPKVVSGLCSDCGATESSVFRHSGHKGGTLCNSCYKKDYRLRNAEGIKERRAEKYRLDPEKYLASNREKRANLTPEQKEARYLSKLEWRTKNAESVKESKTNHYQANKEQYSERRKAKYQEEKDETLKKLKTEALIRAAQNHGAEDSPSEDAPARKDISIDLETI